MNRSLNSLSKMTTVFLLLLGSNVHASSISRISLSTLKSPGECFSRSFSQVCRKALLHRIVQEYESFVRNKRSSGGEDGTPSPEHEAYNRAELFKLAKITPIQASGSDASLARSSRAYLASYLRTHPRHSFQSISDESAILHYLMLSPNWSVLDTEVVSFSSCAPIDFIKEVFTQPGVWPMEISFRKVKNLSKILSTIYYDLWGTEAGKDLPPKKLAELHQHTLDLIQQRTDLYKLLEGKCKSAQELNRSVNMLLSTAFWNCSLSLKTLSQYYIDQMTQDFNTHGTVDIAQLMVQRAAPTYPFFTYTLLYHLDQLLLLKAHHQQDVLRRRKKTTQAEMKFLKENGVQLTGELALPTKSISAVTVHEQRPLMDLTTEIRQETPFDYLQKRTLGPLTAEQLPETIVLNRDGTWAFVQSVFGNDLSPTIKTSACFNTAGVQSGRHGTQAASGASVEKLVNLKHDASLTDQRITLLLGAPSFILRQICRHMAINREFLPQETAQSLIQSAVRLAILKKGRLLNIPRPRTPIYPTYKPLKIRSNKGRKLDPNKKELFERTLQTSYSLTTESLKFFQKETDIPTWFWSAYRTSGDFLYLRMTFSPKELTGLLMERLLNKNAQEETRQVVGMVSAIFQVAYPKTTKTLLQRSKDQQFLDEVRQKLRTINA